MNAERDELRIVDEAIAALRCNPYVRISGQNWALRTILRNAVRQAAQLKRDSTLPLLNAPAACPVVLLEH